MPVIVGATASVEWKAGGSGSATLTVRRPDGSNDTPTVTGTSGTFAATVPATIPGRYLLTWSREGDRYVDVLDVWPADPRYIVSIAEATGSLGQIQANRAGGSDVALLVATATWVIEKLSGTVVRETRTYRPRRDVVTVVLPDAPVSNVSATRDGVPVDLGHVDEDAGIVELATTGGVVITYTAGLDELPANLRLAALDLVGHLYRSGRQTGAPGGVEAAADTVATPFGFAVPRRVVELCAATPRLAGGFA